MEHTSSCVSQSPELSEINSAFLSSYTFYGIIKKIRSNFGLVYICTGRSKYGPANKITFVIKKITYDYNPMELEIMKIDFPFTPKLLGSSQHADGVYMLMEYTGVSVYTIYNARPTDLSEFKNFLMKGLKMLIHFQEEGIVHSDIKTKNMTISSEKKVYMIDFGFGFISSDGREENPAIKHLMSGSFQTASFGRQGVEGKGSYRGDLYSMCITSLYLLLGVEMNIGLYVEQKKHCYIINKDVYYEVLTKYIGSALRLVGCEITRNVILMMLASSIDFKIDENELDIVQATTAKMCLDALMPALTENSSSTDISVTSSGLSPLTIRRISASNSVAVDEESTPNLSGEESAPTFIFPSLSDLESSVAVKESSTSTFIIFPSLSDL